MTAQQVRPLGRVAAPLRRQVAEHGSNPESVIAAIKGDIMTVQRRVDELRRLDRSSPDMEFLERHLLTLLPTPGDEAATAETINTLLEMLAQRLNTLAVAALSVCDEDTGSVQPGRIGGVVALADFVGSIADRKRLWDAAAPTLQDASCQPELLTPSGGNRSDGRGQTAGRTALDDALNEPTVSQLRRLIADQRGLQVQLQNSIEQNNHAAAKAKEEAAKMSHQAEMAKRQAEQALSDMTRQRDVLQRKLLDLQLEVKKSHDSHAHAAQPAAAAASRDQHNHVDDDAHEALAIVQMAAGRLSFTRVDSAILEAAGVDAARLVQPSAAESELLASKVQASVNEVLSGASGEMSTTKSKSKQKSQAALSEATPNVEGVLWWMLSVQGDALSKIAQHAATLAARVAGHETEGNAEVARLKRIIAALNERVNSVKATAQREAEMCRSQQQQQQASQSEARPAGAAHNVNIASRHSTETQPSKARSILAVKGGSLTPEMREKELLAHVAHQHQCIQDLQKQIAAAQQALADEQRRTAAAARESASLLQRSHGANAKLGESKANIELLENEVQQLRAAHQVTKKELRERTASEAELQQTKWKLEVELHIAQNVIDELRQREEALTGESKEANECRGLMSTTLAEERRKHAAELASLRTQLRDAKAAEDVARQVLESERAKMLEHEREVDRLRALDLQMDVLEQNFTNYAACKLAQREAVEEEERVLQGCVDNIGRDVFLLPAGTDSEEKVTLYLQKLQAAKAAFDAEERARKRQKATAVNWKDDRSSRKQLAQTMQQRYNAIQIFACEQRLRQILLERQRAAVVAELDDYRSRHETLMLELSHAKSQCDGLVQRNSELEMQRKEFTRGRVAAEQEIKTLRNTIHKMRISNEEQEKVLIDVGTRLQQAKGKDGGTALAL